ncbi:MAG: glycosyltransferase [Candidatus Binatia bacterium]
MSRSIVVFCMGGVGHVKVLAPLIAGLGKRGCTVRVMTRLEFRGEIEAAGGTFVDLYAGRPLEAVDATSLPLPCRFVTYAAAYAPAVASEISAWAPELIAYDTYTVIAPVVARLLGVPYVNVCPNHAPVPSRTIAALREDPRVAISEECWAAVDRLEREYGFADASPFFYVQALSPFLNLYCEPPEFLRAEDRAEFEPLEVLSSLPEPPPARARSRRSRRRNLYASFGTGVWRYFDRAALGALTVVARSVAETEADLLISLGGHALPAAAHDELASANVRIAGYVDQHAVLAEADLLLTHHGLNSTHESIFHEVPMLSYPFFGDQPALARRCQDLGLALPLTDSPREAIDPDRFKAALARVEDEREAFASRLAEARAWECRTIANRGAVVDRVLELIAARP